MTDGAVTRLDFGRGDDGYKRVWAGRRALHIGVMSVDILRRPMLLARHVLGRAARRLRAS
jgi:CelD/BcsL family acetyltransferase involved in cellulose biosynthesis